MQQGSDDIHAENFRVFAQREGSALLDCPEGFSIPAGGLCAIIGPNGAGKTSLLRGIGGIAPSQGKVLLGSQALEGLSPRERAQSIAIQPQGRARAEGLSVREYVAASLGAQVPWFAGVTKEGRERVFEKLKLAGAHTFADRRLSTLSGGEAARVALAATLVGGAKWLLLDEPCAALDPGAAHHFWFFLQGLVKREGYSIAIIEHDLALARSFADSAILISEGCLHAQGSVAEVMDESLLSEVYNTKLRFLDAGDGNFALAVGGESGGPA